MQSFDLESTYASWARKIRKKRDSFEWSQEKLAHVTGLSQPTISRIESGVQVPSDDAKQRLAGALRSTFEDLFPWPVEAPPIPDVDLEIRGAA